MILPSVNLKTFIKCLFYFTNDKSVWRKAFSFDKNICEYVDGMEREKLKQSIKNNLITKAVQVQTTFIQDVLGFSCTVISKGSAIKNTFAKYRATKQITIYMPSAAIYVMQHFNNIIDKVNDSIELDLWGIDSMTTSCVDAMFKALNQQELIQKSCDFMYLELDSPNDIDLIDKNIFRRVINCGGRDSYITFKDNSEDMPIRSLV